MIVQLDELVNIFNNALKILEIEAQFEKTEKERENEEYISEEEDVLIFSTFPVQPKAFSLSKPLIIKINYKKNQIIIEIITPAPYANLLAEPKLFPASMDKLEKLVRWFQYIFEGKRPELGSMMKINHGSTTVMIENYAIIITTNVKGEIRTGLLQWVRNQIKLIFAQEDIPPGIPSGFNSPSI